jgi:hypothetical protein
MKKTRTGLKSEFIAEAEALFDELMAWDESTPEPDLMQIEEVVLQLRQRLGEQLAQTALGGRKSVNRQRRILCLVLQESHYPFMTATGRKRATLRAIPALATVSTTSSTSL